ncbi:LamG domain-containing protein, partial [Candidatus Parcubacteria bacterium]|nr:LamG domain-containing protein [Candidatus Parcubacteria bacterium]
SNTVTLSNNGNTAIAVAEIDGAWTVADTTAVGINHWTTSASNYVKIWTTDAARHEGVWGEGKYRLEVGYMPIIIAEEYVRVEGLQINNNNNVSSVGIYIDVNTNNGDWRIFNNIIKSTVNSSYGIRIYEAGTGIKIWNNIVYDFAIGINSNVVTNGSVFIYNNTVYNCTTGFRTGYLDFVAKNNIAQDCATGFSGSFDSSSTHNISDDATAPAYGTYYRDTDVNFTDEANNNFHLAPSDTAARDAGADLSADANLSFTDDIDGETRPAGAGWDIGADELKRSTQINTPHANKWTDGLVGYWSFDGQDMDWANSTAEALDTSGNSNHGDVINGASPVIGKVGQGLEFDGVDYIRFYSKPFNTETITVCAWVKSTLGGSIMGNLQFILSISSETLKSTSNGYGNTAVASASACPINTWHYVCANRFASDQTTTLYVNGEVSGTPNQSTPITSSIWDYGIGTRCGNAPAWSFYGIIDEVRIYNRALSADEIAEQYRVGARKFQTNTPITNYLTDGLVGHWTFNGEDMDWSQSTAEARDTSGNNNHGDVINGALPVIGRVGQGMEFDGVDDYVELILDFFGVGTTTACAWVYPDLGPVRISIMGNTQFVLSLNSTGTVQSTSNGFSNTALSNASACPDDTWSYVCVTRFASDDTTTIYVNGEVSGAPNQSTPIVSSTFFSAIGSRAGKAAYAWGFQGQIDEVRVYNRALSADEIGQLYRVGARKVGL